MNKLDVMLASVVALVVGAVLCFMFSPWSSLYKNAMSTGDIVAVITAVVGAMVTVLGALKLRDRIDP